MISLMERDVTEPTALPMAKPDLLNAAIGYAKNRWHVVPLHTPRESGCSCVKGADCPSPGKHPRLDTGKDHERASTDPVQITKWWSMWPDANVGIVTGARSGLLVVDVDARNDGDLSLEELESKNQRFPHTVEAQTGHAGGRHIYLAHPGGRLPNTAGILGKGIDTRGDGGLVVAPPSLHASGRAYAWEGSSEPGMVPLSPAPEWLLAKTRPVVTGEQRPRVDVGSVLAGVPKGERDDELTSYAASLRARGYERAEAEILILAAARAAVPPFPEASALQKVESAWKNIPNRREPEVVQSGPFVDPSRSLAEQLEKPPAPLTYKVKGILPDRALLGIVGRPKVRKTFFARQLCFCLAAGVPFVGFEVGDPCRVLYIDEETGETALYHRFLHNRAGHPAFNEPDFLQRVRTVSFQKYRIGDDRLRAQIEAVEPGFLVFDSYRRILQPGKNESDSGDTAEAMEFLSDLRNEYRLPLAIIHHTRKNVGDGESWEDSARGSGDFFAAVDGMLGLSKLAGGAVKVRGTFRVDADLEPFTLAFNPDTLLFETTTAQPENPEVGFDALAAIESYLRSMLAGEALQTAVRAHLEQHHRRTSSQSERDVRKVHLVSRESPPPGLRIGKEAVPGSNGNQKRLFLIEVPS